MNPEKLENIARIMAEDMIELAESGLNQFPVDARMLIDSLPEKSLIKIMHGLKKVHGNIPLGYTLLFLMPRKIPVKEKGDFFRELVDRLYDLRVDFSQRTTIEIKERLYELPERWIEIEANQYRKLVFMLENLNELRVPVFRGWGYDFFSFNGFFYRVYNLGTIEKPEYLFLKSRISNRVSATVFGHIRDT